MLRHWQSQHRRISRTTERRFIGIQGEGHAPVNAVVKRVRVLIHESTVYHTLGLGQCYMLAALDTFVASPFAAPEDSTTRDVTCSVYDVCNDVVCNACACQ